ncbi:hypothetical protein HY346_00915 [Candidatus Microgenomates bacterium]|nr:hypothetical protein [Candidatus Microgenomates bacterium]
MHVYRHLPVQDRINVSGNSTESLRARLLSNFSPHPVRVGGINAATVESFLQAIKYPPRSVMRRQLLAADARFAKRNSPDPAPEIIQWGRATFEYRSGPHMFLQTTAVFAKFDQNEEAAEALLATGYLPLDHVTGIPERPDTCLQAFEFCHILAETRGVLLTEMGYASGLDETPAFVTPEVVQYSRS